MSTSGGKAVRKRTARKDNGKASSKKKLLGPQVSNAEQDDPYEFCGTQSLQLALNTTPTRIVFMQKSPKSPQLSVVQKPGKPKKSPSERQQDKLWKLEEYHLQRAIEESRKQQQAEERKRRIHKRDESSSSGLASASKLRTNDCTAAKKSKTKTKRSEKVNRQEKEVQKKSPPEDIRSNDNNDVAPTAVLDEEKSPSVLDNMLGIPMHSPEEQQHHSVTHIEGGESVCTTARLSEEIDQAQKSTNPEPTQSFDVGETMDDNQPLDVQHSPTCPDSNLIQSSVIKAATDVSTQELSHSPSPSNTTPTTSPQQSLSHGTSCLSRNTMMILKALDTHSAKLRATQENNIQRVPWGKPVHSVCGQPWDSLERRRTMRQSRRSLAREKAYLLELSSGVVSVRQEDEMDEFVGATEASPSALHHTPRHTSQSISSSKSNDNSSRHTDDSSKRHSPQIVNSSTPQIVSSRHTPQDTSNKHTPQNASSSRYTTRNVSSRCTPQNTSNEHTPQNASNEHTPQNASNKHTPQNASSSRHTPQIVSSRHTPQIVSSRHTPQNASNEHTPQNANSSRYTTRNVSSRCTPQNASNEHTPQNASNEHTPQNVSSGSRHTPQSSRHFPQSSRLTPQSSRLTAQNTSNIDNSLQTDNNRQPSSPQNHANDDLVDRTPQTTNDLDQAATPLSRRNTAARTPLMKDKSKKLSLSLRKMSSMNTSLSISDALSHRELFDSSSQDLSKEVKEHPQRDEEMDIENENDQENQPRVQKRGRKEYREEERVLRSRSSYEAEYESEEMTHNELPDKPPSSMLLSQQSANSFSTDRIPQLRIPRIRHKKIQKIESSSEDENGLEEEIAEKQKQTDQSPEKIVEIDLTSEPPSPCASSTSSKARVTSSQEQSPHCTPSSNHPPTPQSCHKKTPSHRQFVQRVFQEDDDEVENFSNSSSSSDGWPTLSAIQRPRKRRRTEKASSNRHKLDDSEDDLVLLGDRSESQPHSTEQQHSQHSTEQQHSTEEDDDRDTTPVLEGVPFYMTTDGGYAVDPTAISSSPIRSYQHISSLNERSNFDYSNQFATSAKKKRSASSSRQGETSRKAKSASRKKRFFGGMMRGRGRGGRRGRGKR